MKVCVDQFLLSNWLFIKSCCFLWSKSVNDLIFIPHFDKVVIKSITRGTSELIAEISHKDFNQMIFQLKLYAKIDILNNKMPESFSINLKIDNKICWFRCSLHPSLHGNSLAIRFIRPNFFQWNDSLNFKGLNIIFGKTGSGKTTMLYGIMTNFIGHIISLEDPIEYELLNVCQTDISHIGYSECIKSAMRLNPNLIIIGEIRDSNSANAAILAALTGHAVIATMHAGSFDDLFLRMKQMNCLNFEKVINKFMHIQDYKITETVSYQ
jgi:type II secretory ATPase GspE/PulE/Tfp pilus assembly ATPase PilB-like protein